MAVWFITLLKKINSGWIKNMFAVLSGLGITHEVRVVAAQIVTACPFVTGSLANAHTYATKLAPALNVFQ